MMGRHGWNSGDRRWRLTALLGVGAAVLALVVTLLNTLAGNGGSTAGTTRDGDKVHGTPATPSGDTGPDVGWGFTHTQFSADEGSKSAVERVEERLGEQPLPQIQHIMGWGADNPEPVKGRYDFEEMDRRIDFVRATGGTPVVTLCCAPDWMKGGRSGADSTDWSQAALETAPEPEHFADYAALAATVARRTRTCGTSSSIRRDTLRDRTSGCGAPAGKFAAAYEASPEASQASGETSFHVAAVAVTGRSAADGSGNRCPGR